MKLLLSFVLLLPSGMQVVSTAGMTNGINSASTPVGSNAKLQLTTSVIEYLSCFPNDLTLRLRFTFKNVGTENVILEKRSSIVGRHLVSRDLEGLAAKKYEEEGRAEYDSGPDIPDALEVPTDMSNFITLAPGEVFEVESAWSRVHFVVNDGTRYSEAGLRVGSHFLQVEVGTWPHASESVVVRARRQWRNRGLLWTEPLISLPMQFTIDPNRPISKCR